MPKREGSADVIGLKSTDGSALVVDETGYQTAAIATYYFPLAHDGSDLESVQVITDGTIVATFTVETCNLPGTNIAQQNGRSVTDWDTTSGNWVQENPTTAYVGSVGTGWSIAALTLTKSAGVGGAMIHFGNFGAKRLRLKAVVTTGGKLRVTNWGKPRA